MLVVGLLAGLVLMDVLPAEPMTYRSGQYIPADILARVGFRILSAERLNALRSSIDRDTPPVFEQNALVTEKILTAMKSLPEQLGATTQPADVEEAYKAFAFTAENFAEIRKALTDPQRRQLFDNSLNRFEEELNQTYVIRANDQIGKGIWRDAGIAQMMISQGNSVPKDRSALISLTEVDRVNQRIHKLAKSFEPVLQPHVRAFLKVTFVGDSPTYTYDAATTQDHITAQRNALSERPPAEAYTNYAKGQLLVLKSRRTGPRGEQIIGLQGSDLKILRAEHEHYFDAEKQSHPWRRWGRIAGRSVVLLVVVLMLSFYIARYQSQIISHHWRGFAVVVILLLMVGLSRAMVFGLGLNGYSVLVASMLAAILLTIAYDQRFALTISGALAALIVLQLRLDLSMLTVVFLSSATAVFQLQEIRTRTKLISTAAIVAAIVFAVVGAIGMIQAVPWRFVLIDGVWGVGMTLLAGVLAQTLLPMIERLFGITTSMTLLEWCDASKPLLKRLSTEAPGTWNHSLQLGAMCEAAANAIGARGLLARVGAYYHDIGKINKPPYFVENQGGAASKHEKLSPAMSLLIIIGHVKDGLEMAREYGLPSQLHEFIATHHGTTLVQYFYHAATEQRKNGDQRAPDETEFRYPGPKPYSKETGILMLADASESSVRAMSQPTPGRIENQVHTMVTRRLMDGQLDECNMTLKEVHQVEASLTKSLCAIYHARIAYPTPPGEKPSAAEIEREQRLAQAEQEKAASEPADTEADKKNVTSEPADTKADKKNAAPEPADTEADKKNAAPEPANTKADKKKAAPEPADTKASQSPPAWPTGSEDIAE